MGGVLTGLSPALAAAAAEERIKAAAEAAAAEKAAADAAKAAKALAEVQKVRSYNKTFNQCLRV